MHAAIIGLGLMGGSLALALRRSGWANRITGVARRPETLAAARAAGAIDRGAADLASAPLDEADVIVLATPVRTLLRQLPEVGRLARPGAVILDLGSTKAAICAEMERLPEGPRFYPPEQITDIYMRDLAAELIREQILLQIREEIPHGTAVAVDEFKERETGMVYIHAIIFVEREAHKKIVIGAGGAQLRAIGAEARKEIERMLGTRVYLELWVKVEPQWRRNEKALRRLGYASQD